MARLNSTLDDIAHVAGYTAARRIAVWYPARDLYIPSTARPGHPLDLLVGRSAFQRLVRAFAQQSITIPSLNEEKRDERERAIAQALADGASPATLATTHGITERRVRQIRQALTDNGLLDFARLEPDQI